MDTWFRLSINEFLSRKSIASFDMSGKNFILLLFSFLLLSSAPKDQYPETEISNGILRAKIYLPDSKNGFYRGSRFDWGGVMPVLEFQDHSYFGTWYTNRHDPAFHDHIAGPVEEFTPIGYEEAKTGTKFLKIGVQVRRIVKI